MTILVPSIYADPSEIADKQSAARALALLVHADPEDVFTTQAQIATRLNDGHNFAWIARRVTPQIAAAVKALNMKGIYFQKEFARFYPDNQLAAQVLGYVGSDDNGLGGLEEKFDTDLHGAPGLMYTAMDARRQVLGSSERDPQPGQNLVLTVDENIQFMAERALDHAMQKTQALNGTVVVQDVHTGQILALAIRPTFNPNQIRHAAPDLLRDHAVSDVYEPGSVFKLVTYSAAMDSAVAKPDDMIDCSGGQINVAGQVIHDDKSDRGLGTITVADALAHSSDVCAIKLALRVGPDKMYRYIRDFGFGARSSVELPGETRGLLRPLSRWRPASIGYVAIGQEVAVTPLQLVSMVSTIANGGTYLPPRILMQGSATALDQKAAAPQVPQGAQFAASPVRTGEELPSQLPPGAHRVISELAAAQMRKMMEGVVLFGTGKEAQLDGYSSGGKTGTAQKIDPATHAYSKTMHIASFAGFAPVNSPVIAVAVVLDSPKGEYYATATTAPVFAEVAQQILEYLGVQHDIDLRPADLASTKNAAVIEDDAPAQEENIQALYDAANDLPSDDPLRAPPASAAKAAPPPNPASTQAPNISPSPKTSTASGPSPSAPAVSRPQLTQSPTTNTVIVADAGQLHVPALIGLPIREIIEQAESAGLEVEIAGDGIAREQVPAPGTAVSPGTKIVVRCSR
jgi:cell division protein FtsI (penicillin-binding protein 3)